MFIYPYTVGLNGLSIKGKRKTQFQHLWVQYGCTFLLPGITGSTYGLKLNFTPMALWQDMTYLFFISNLVSESNSLSNFQGCITFSKQHYKIPDIPKKNFRMFSYFLLTPLNALTLMNFIKLLWSLTNGTQYVNDDPEKSTE